MSPLLLAIAALLVFSSCARPVVPEPEEAVDRYLAAVQSGDEAALYGMLTEESQRAYGRRAVGRLLADSRPELAKRAAKLGSDKASIDVKAMVPFEDGEEAVLAVESGEFRVTAAGALPAGARTPAQALGELRQVLARRSYPGLLRLLSDDTRLAIERDLASLVDGLVQPESLPVEVEGDRAEVTVPGGHKVWLEREAGIWKIRDFE